MAYLTNAKLRGIQDKDGKDVFFKKVVIQKTDKLPAMIAEGIAQKFATQKITLDKAVVLDSVIELLNQIQHDSYKVLNGLVAANVPVRKDVTAVEM